MSFDGFLNQTCIINRPIADGVDRYNANTYEDTAVGTDVPCRLIEKSVKLMDAKTSEYTWVKALVLLLPSGTNVQTKDEATIEGLIYRVRQMLNRKRGNAQHHVSCVVEVVNG